MKNALLLLFTVSFLIVKAQKPANGQYTYKLSYAEWQGKSLNNTVLVIIQNDSITLVNNGSTTGTKGEVIEKGLLMKHQSGKWIIGKSVKDRYTKKLNGCEGPRIIDFKRKTVTSC